MRLLVFILGLLFAYGAYLIALLIPELHRLLGWGLFPYLTALIPLALNGLVAFVCFIITFFYEDV